MLKKLAKVFWRQYMYQVQADNKLYNKEEFAFIFLDIWLTF